MNQHTAEMFAGEFCSLMELEGYTKAGDYLQVKPASVIQLSDGQHKRAIGPAVIAGKPLIQTSDAMVLTSHSVSIGQDLSMQQQLDFNPVSQQPTPILPQQQSQRQQGNKMAPGNVVGTGRNIGRGNSMVGSQGSGNVRRGVPRAGRKGASPLAILDLNPMETTPRIAQRRSGSRGRGSRGRGSRGRGSDIYFM